MLLLRPVAHHLLYHQQNHFSGCGIGWSILNGGGMMSCGI